MGSPKYYMSKLQIHTMAELYKIKAWVIKKLKYNEIHQKFGETLPID